jgi:stage 0 sporulation protein B (sporulation initiation phosphotransferase)
MLMKREWKVVEVLSHSRHDWLNKIQLIKGNLSLNKIDRVKEIIEEIVHESQNESHLTNLKMLKFAGLLMTYNWEQHHFRVEYEVLGDVKDLSRYDELIYDWCIEFFSVLNHSIDCNGDNNLSISIETFTNELRFFFDFSGIITDGETVNNWFEKEQSADNFFELLDFQLQTDEMLVVLRVKIL